MGDLDHAIADYDEAIRLNPKFAVAVNNRGSGYKQKGDRIMPLSSTMKQSGSIRSMLPRSTTAALLIGTGATWIMRSPI
jgi:hypothetical protein